MAGSEVEKITEDTAKQGTPLDIQQAWKILAGGSPVAAAALVEVAAHGKSEVARVQASTAILDRVGLATPKERPEVHFTVIPHEMEEHPQVGQLTPAEVIRSRLKELQGPTQMLVAGKQDAVYAAMQGTQGTEDAEVVEAELLPMQPGHGAQDEDDWGDPWS